MKRFIKSKIICAEAKNSQALCITKQSQAACVHLEMRVEAWLDPFAMLHEHSGKKSA
jgi:hypothetical protein